jgi:ceramide glucosyltransferase
MLLLSTAAYLVLILARVALSARFLARAAPQPADDDRLQAEVTVLQPILGGDPALEACLSANLRAHPDTRFVWLVDEDDAAGRAAAERAADGPRVSVVVGPPPADGENPKAAKLARALPQVETPFCAVLDDDTVLPPGALARAAASLESGGVACGLPVYAASANVWSRLVAGFVNGASLITYPAAALLGAQRTLNGMFYVVRTEELRRRGGFDAIARDLTDDYAMAKLYLEAGLPIVQTTVVHPVTTTVRDAGHYVALMRRWMIFANRYVAENLNAFTLGLIGASTLAPLPLLLAALALGDPAALAAVLVALGVKACAVAWIKRRYAAMRTTIVDGLCEIAADLLTPAHLAAALVRPRRLAWRSRAIRLEGGGIVYERRRP